MLKKRYMDAEKNIRNFRREGSCPIRDVLAPLGDKWSMLVLVTIDANGVMRFGEILKAVGDVSQRMLAVTLRGLEADGMVRRQAYAEVPPRVEYALTDRARSLMPHLYALIGWAQDNMGGILAGRNAAGRRG